MTNHRRRFVRIAKWIGTAITSLILATWVLSLPVTVNGGLSFSFVRVPRVWGISGGAFNSYDFPGLGMATGFYIGFNSTARNRWESFGVFLPYHTLRAGAMVSYSLPLWIPFLAIVIPTAILWHLERRERLAGHCPTCNYNLTGNTSGICPECGTSIPPQQMQRTKKGFSNLPESH